MRAHLVLCAGIWSAAATAQRGVPDAGFPSWYERMVHVYVNRARADPAADLAACSVCAEKACYQARPPVSYSYALNRAARFHSANLSRTGRFQHDSPCTLVTNISSLYAPNGTCDGSASCACQGGTAACSGTCTGMSQRVSLFGATATGENIAGNFGSPRRVFYAWLHEPDSSPACGPRQTNGHRYNILVNGPAMGVGHDVNDTQDFGLGPAPLGTLIAGGHEPQQSGGDVEFRVNYYDTRGPPQAALLNVDGQCVRMERERGTDTNATYLAVVNLPGNACRRYRFQFADPAGATVVLPEVGSYGVGFSEATCPDWAMAEPAACAALDAGTGTGEQDGGGGAMDGGSSGGSNGPSVRIVSPEPGGRVVGPDVALEAEVSPDAVKVSFELDGFAFAERTEPPWTGVAKNVTPGFRTFAAVATDSSGRWTRSSPVSVMVEEPKGCGCSSFPSAMPLLSVAWVLRSRSEARRRASRTSAARPVGP